MQTLYAKCSPWNYGSIYLELSVIPIFYPDEIHRMLNETMSHELRTPARIKGKINYETIKYSTM